MTKSGASYVVFVCPDAIVYFKPIIYLVPPWLTELRSVLLRKE